MHHRPNAMAVNHLSCGLAKTRRILQKVKGIHEWASEWYVIPIPSLQREFIASLACAVTFADAARAVSCHPPS